MTDSVPDRTQFCKTAYVGCCLPRRCGIATFTYDLATASSGVTGDEPPVFIVAVNDRPGGYAYPDCVKLQIDYNDPHDYRLAAEFLNDSCGVVCLQHEFGLFGAPWGNNVLHLVRGLHRPLVVTCHTVPVDPDPDQRRVFAEIVDRADRLTVMNHMAIDFLQALYGAHYDQIVLIPHGIHDIPFTDPPARKSRLGVVGPVLLTFGLLSRNKGLETAIDAMAEIVRERPVVTYVIAGRTHPRIVESEGESYRRSLQGRVRRLGLEDNVLFIDKFADLSDLVGYLQETDIFVAPYLNPDHMTSGVLAYAAGAGKPIVATPFLHARELLADGRGRMGPFRNSHALARHVLEMLADPRGTAAMRRRIYKHTRNMVWGVVAQRYLALFDTVRRSAGKRPRTRPAKSAKSAAAGSAGWYAGRTFS